MGSWGMFYGRAVNGNWWSGKWTLKREYLKRNA